MSDKHNLNSFKDRFLNNLLKFNPQDRIIFDRIYKVHETKGSLVPPKEMINWIIENFGDLENVINQDFLKITNTIMYEGAVYNELRMRRPMERYGNYAEVLEKIQNEHGGPFSEPLTMTPADTFGRVKGKYCITACNIAKYDGLHGLIIFDDPNPLHFTKERLRDYFRVAREWFIKAHKTNNNAVYPFLNWNCLWKASASITHGHLQLELTEGQAYSKVEKLRYLSLRYQEKYRTNYFDDVFKIHSNLGLGFEKNNIKIIVNITPIKEKETILYGPIFNDDIADIINDILNTFKNSLNVMSFNLVITLPPMEYTPEVWQHVPIIINIVDRGNLDTKTADMGSLELYGQSIIGSNPYQVFEELKKSLNRS